jgi:hypothetical protein
MGDPNEPSMWLILGLGLALMGGFIFVLWGVSRLSDRPKSEAEEHAAPVTTRPIKEEAPQVKPPLGALIISLVFGRAGPVEALATPVAATLPIKAQRLAKPGNVVNDALTGNVLPDEVRDVVRFWAMVESAERVIAGGKLGQTEAVELVFACKRSGRPDSTYARAVAAIKARSDAAYRERQAHLVALQAATEEA